MYSQGGYYSRGKIPGPASKTLFRSKSTKTSSQSSTSISNQGGSGMHSQNKSLTFASALTDCWNSSNNGGSSSSTNSLGNSTPNGNQERTSCLFCCNLVIIPSNSGSDKSNEKRSRMLKNLTFHMKLSSKDIPEQCSRTMFPFCNVCEEFVKQLWDFQGMLDKIKLKMSKLVTTIERTVVDGEILNPKINRNSSQQQRFIKLREMILHGYRNKLLVKSQIRENQILGNSVADFEPIANLKREQNEEVVYDPQNFNSSLCPSPSSSGRSEETVDLTNTIEQDIIEELDVIEISEELSPSTSSNSGSLPSSYSKEKKITAFAPNYEKEHDQQHFSYDETEDNELENVHEDNSYWEQNVDIGEAAGSSNETNCTLVISNIHGSDGASFTAETPSFKQEMHAEDNENDEEVDVDVEGDNGSESMQMEEESDDDIFMLESRKRRLLFEGVEIYKCFGSKPGTEFLQCSICSYTLDNPRRASNGDVTAFTKLKIHIQTVHPQSIPTRIQVPSKRSHGCGICNVTTTKEETAHSPEPAENDDEDEEEEENFSECDICGRKIKSGSEFNLLLHKFSHKNDDERRAAIAANERGTHNGLLSTRFKSKRDKKARKRSQTLINTPNESCCIGDRTCKICNRTFPKKCYLTLHMRVHSGQNRWPTAKPQEEQKDELDSGPPVLQAQQVPVITYPPAKKKSDLTSNIKTQSTRMEDICSAIVIARKENRAALTNTTVGEAVRAPILKREVTL